MKYLCQGLAVVFLAVLCTFSLAQSMFTLSDLKEVTSPHYEFLGAETEGMRPVAAYLQNPDLPRVKDLKWGFINSAGRVVTGPANAPKVRGTLAVDAVGPFSGGYAPVMWRAYENTPELPQRRFHEEKGFIDKDGKVFRSRPAVRSESPIAPHKPPAQATDIRSNAVDGDWVITSNVGGGPAVGSRVHVRNVRGSFDVWFGEKEPLVIYHCVTGQDGSTKSIRGSKMWTASDWMTVGVPRGKSQELAGRVQVSVTLSIQGDGSAHYTAQGQTTDLQPWKAEGSLKRVQKKSGNAYRLQERQRP